MNLEELTEAVLRRLGEETPKALLLGTLPQPCDTYRWVTEAPYDAVVLGQLPAGELLRMPTDPVCQALLDGIPVYLWPEQPYRSARHGKALCRELAAAEQRLKRLGVEAWGGPGRLLTAKDARQLVLSGKPAPLNCRLTPLARDILEGRDT